MQLLNPEQYQSRAEQAFLETSRELEKMIPGARIEHVGSSAISGAISKGDIDICVVVAQEEHGNRVNQLVLHGYKVKLGTLRTPQLCMLESPRTDIDIALQVVAKNSEFEFFMKFRDALRQNPEMVAEYNALKKLNHGRGEERYREEKSKFILSVLREA